MTSLNFADLSGNGMGVSIVGLNGPVLVADERFGFVGNGTTSDDNAFESLIAAMLVYGVPAYFLKASYLITEPVLTRLSERLTYATAFAPSLTFIGSGMGRTVFVNAASNGSPFDFDTNDPHTSLFRAVLGLTMRDLTIRGLSTTEKLTLGTPVNQVGIKLRTCFNADIERVHIKDLLGTGVQIVCENGDLDGSVDVNLNHVRIELCTKWGIDALPASGFNELSYIKTRHVFIQNCGVAEAISLAPTSGGMRWKGQGLDMVQTAFVLNQNVGLHVVGASGLGQLVNMQTVTFENNYKRGLLCTGLSNMNAVNTQFYNNDSATASVQCEFEASSFVIRNISMVNSVVRATSGNNAITAFKVGGANAFIDSIRITNTHWDNFDYTGQSRFDGVQHPDVINNSELVVIDASTIRIRPKTVEGVGNKYPIQLRGPVQMLSVANVVPSTTGEIVARRMASTGFSRAFPITFTGDISNGSPVIGDIKFSGVLADANRLVIGGGISGAGIPGGATIVSVDSPTQITISANATATTGDVALSNSLAINTVYNVYSLDFQGTSYHHLSTTAPAVNTSNGLLMKGQFLWHGRIATDGAGAIKITGANHLKVKYSNEFQGYVWIDSAGTPKTRISATQPTGLDDTAVGTLLN